MKELFRVTVAGVIIPIFRATSKEVDDLKDDDGEDLLGCFVPEKGAIYITQGQPAGLERDTINHEIIHAWINLSGALRLLRLHFRKADDPDEVEEALVRVLTPHVHLIDWCK